MTCDAEDRIKRALYELELQRGAGIFNHPEIRAILVGAKCDCKPEPTE